MIILPLKSRLQIVKERENPKAAYTAKNIMMFVAPTPAKNVGPDEKHRAVEFVRLVVVVSKKIHNRAVVRNTFRRRIKEAFRSIDHSLLENKHDYQILARHAIFSASVESLKTDIEKCLKGEAIIGVPERTTISNKKRNNKGNTTNKIKTSLVLKTKLI